MIQPSVFTDKVRMTVTGSRSIIDGNFIFKCLDDFVTHYGLEFDKLVLNSGTAKGVDTIAEVWATVRGVKVERFPADWKTFGKSAGMIRNKIMVDNCQYVCGIWDQKSRGTKGCIDYAKEQRKVVKVYTKPA